MQSEKISYLMQHIATVMARQNDQILQERLGIGFSQFKILKVLEKHPSIKQKQIAHALGQTEASISRQIKLLIEQGLLTIHIPAENRREHITVLTSRGLRFTDEAIKILKDHHAPVFASLSDKQRTQLTDILDVLHQASCQADWRAESHHLHGA